jgi:hypothetical protein
VMNIPDHISESLETVFFGLKILKFFDADPDPGSGIFLTACIRDRKIRITDLFLIFFSDRLGSDERFPRYRENKCLPDRLSAPGTLSFN